MNFNLSTFIAKSKNLWCTVLESRDSQSWYFVSCWKEQSHAHQLTVVFISKTVKIVLCKWSVVEFTQIKFFRIFVTSYRADTSDKSVPHRSMVNWSNVNKKRLPMHHMPWTPYRSIWLHMFTILPFPSCFHQIERAVWHNCHQKCISALLTQHILVWVFLPDIHNCSTSNWCIFRLGYRILQQLLWRLEHVMISKADIKWISKKHPKRTLLKSIERHNKKPKCGMLLL